MTKGLQPVEILERTAALAETDHNLEMMDCAAVLHGYLELSALDPDDAKRKRDVDDAVGRLLEAAVENPRWNESLSEVLQAKRAVHLGGKDGKA
jgi:hypothetical protein